MPAAQSVHDVVGAEGGVSLSSAALAVRTDASSAMAVATTATAGAGRERVRIAAGLLARGHTAGCCGPQPADAWSGPMRGCGASASVSGSAGPKTAAPAQRRQAKRQLFLCQNLPRLTQLQPGYCALGWTDTSVGAGPSSSSCMRALRPRRSAGL